MPCMQRQLTALEEPSHFGTSVIPSSLPGFPQHSEIGGTFGLIPYFCTLSVWQHIGDLIIFGGTSQILEVKNPLQRVNGNAISPLQQC